MKRKNDEGGFYWAIFQHWYGDAATAINSNGFHWTISHPLLELKLSLPILLIDRSSYVLNIIKYVPTYWRRRNYVCLSRNA